MKNRTHMLPILALVLLCGLALAAGEDALDHPVRKELNEARVEAGLAKATVVYDRGQKAWRIVAGPGENQATADTLCAAVVSETLLGPLTISIPAGAREVEDALVVLRYDPTHAGALAIVRARYEALRTAARTKRGGGRGGG